MKKRINLFVACFLLAALCLMLSSCRIFFGRGDSGDKCEQHTYDDCADIECNVCGDKRDSMHTWVTADCDSPKTCSVCGKTDGTALGHSPEADDGDCTTEVKCTVCQVVTTPAKTEHIAHADDGDCTTPVKCAECDKNVVAGQTHDFTGDYVADETQHWHVCKNEGCNVTDEKIDHTPDQNAATVTAPKKCTECEYIMEPQLPHEHTYNEQGHNDTHHYMKCSCGEIDESTKGPHSANSDNNCTTDDKCTCGYTVTAAKDHVAGADDGNCNTPIKCVNCDKDAKAGATGHHDADHDYLCDNAGCQVTVGNPPKDTNPGIDLPIDTNN